MIETATIGKAKPKKGVKLRPMTEDEAIGSLAKIDRHYTNWSDELLLFAERRGWKVLGYPSLRACLADRLTVEVATALRAMGEAKARRELAALTPDIEERKRISRVPDGVMRELLKEPDPKQRLATWRKADCNGTGRATGPAIRAVRNGTQPRPTPAATQPQRRTCPTCNGKGWVMP